jgi:hypothetical protein
MRTIPQQKRSITQRSLSAVWYYTLIFIVQTFVLKLAQKPHHLNTEFDVSTIESRASKASTILSHCTLLTLLLCPMQLLVLSAPPVPSESKLTTSAHSRSAPSSPVHVHSALSRASSTPTATTEPWFKARERKKKKRGKESKENVGAGARVSARDRSVRNNAVIVRVNSQCTASEVMRWLRARRASMELITELLPVDPHNTRSNLFYAICASRADEHVLHALGTLEGTPRVSVSQGMNTDAYSRIICTTAAPAHSSERRLLTARASAPTPQLHRCLLWQISAHMAVLCLLRTRLVLWVCGAGQWH